MDSEVSEGAYIISTDMDRLQPDVIAEQGIHEALLARDGVYARLYAHQWVL